MNARTNQSPESVVRDIRRNTRRKYSTEEKIRIVLEAEKAKIKDLSRLHTLRHTFASRLVVNGVDLPTVMKLMGHSDIQTTMIYAHLTPDHLADAVEKLGF